MAKYLIYDQDGKEKIIDKTKISQAPKPSLSIKEINEKGIQTKLF